MKKPIFHCLQYPNHVTICETCIQCANDSCPMKGASIQYINDRAEKIKSLFISEEGMREHFYCIDNPDHTVITREHCSNCNINSSCVMKTENIDIITRAYGVVSEGAAEIRGAIIFEGQPYSSMESVANKAITYLRAQLEQYKKYHASGRYSIEMDGEHLRICLGDHDKNESCQWIKYRKVIEN